MPEGDTIHYAAKRMDTHGKHLFLGLADPAQVQVFDRAGKPCRRCGTAIRARGQGDDNRTTYWCPSCQR